MSIDLQEAAAERGIRYFLICFSDLVGVQRSKLVPAAAIAGMQEEGAGFAGFATHLDMSPAYPDMMAIPDPTSLVQLPWRPEVGWVAADPVIEGEPVAHAPRVVLKRALERARAMGFTLKCGVEPEYFIVNAAGDAPADAGDSQAKPCYDQQALMRRFDLVAEICDAMQDLGWGPYQNDHEDANGQFEMNWDYEEAMVTADRHSFFKFMVRSVAERHGLRATFMPKPVATLTGNGCHVHLSLWDEAGTTNLFKGERRFGLSETAEQFLGGLLHHAAAITALTNPVVNSYKRINAPRTNSGATWSPSSITWAGNNRTHMVRVPAPGRLENRLPDGAANPYLLQAALLHAGLDGIEQCRSPGEPLDIDMYAQGHTVEDAPSLPLNLLDAVRAFADSTVVRAAFGDAFSDAYIRLKTAEWNAYSTHLSDWERRTTLDC